MVLFEVKPITPFSCKITILIVYVKDIILTRNGLGEIEKMKRVIANDFEIKGLGQLRYFLGMEADRTKKGHKENIF